MIFLILIQILIVPQGDNPFQGEKSVSDQVFFNQKVETYKDVENNNDGHLTTLDSQIKSDKPPK